MCKYSSHGSSYYRVILQYFHQDTKEVGCRKKWQYTRTQLPHPPTKINDWTAIHKQKRLEDHLGNFSNTMEQKKNQNNHSRREGINFISPVSSHPPSQHCSVPKRNFLARKSFSHQEKQHGVNNQPLQALCKGPILILLHPDWQS